ncbi:hypothetical protein VTK26DRAFT_9037 [Humicola hyalothermophila]
MPVPSISLLSIASVLFGGAAAGSDGKPQSCQAVDASILASTGTPVGEEIVHNNITMYISRPDANDVRTEPRARAGVLYLTDVFGIALNENKLLVDSFARAGYLALAPDLFSGSPAPGDINVPGFNTTEFLARHGPDVTDPVVATALAYMRDELGVELVLAPGYCFGGRYVFRFLAGDREARVDAGFAAHPSMVGDDEIEAIAGPVSVAAAENDALLTAELRSEMESLLGQTGRPYQVTLFSGTQHGFAVRADLEDAEQRFAKEEAFLQAVRWFDRFVV